MEFNKLVFAGLSVGCLTAVAGGSYLAVRQNQTAVEISSPASDLAPMAPAAADGAKPVIESEGVIAPDMARPEPTLPSDSVEPSRPASRITTATRRADLRSAPASQPVTQRPPTRDANATRQAPESQIASNAPAPSTSGGMWETRPSVQPSAPDYKEAEPAAPPPPPAAEFVDLTVPSDAVLVLQIERTVSS